MTEDYLGCPKCKRAWRKEDGKLCYSGEPELGRMYVILPDPCPICLCVEKKRRSDEVNIWFAEQMEQKAGEVMGKYGIY